MNRFLTLADYLTGTHTHTHTQRKKEVEKGGGNEVRKNDVSFVFQDFNLIDDFTVRENLNMFTDDDGIKEVLEVVKLSHIDINRKISSLSGGERQRIAIARGLMKSSNIMLLDEPTGNLDADTADNIFEILAEISKSKLLLVVTHDIRYAKIYGDQIISMSNGKVINDVKVDRSAYKIDNCNVNNKILDIYNFLTLALVPGH